MREVDVVALIYAVASVAPLYLLLVLVPAIVRMFIDMKILGIDYTMFDEPPPPVRPPSVATHMAYEVAYRFFAITSLYAPFVEELLFRAIPLYILGVPGLVAGCIVWVALHPAVQLAWLSYYPTWKKVAFTLTSLFYYGCAAVFYGLLWIWGMGLVAICYHTMHNLIICAVEIAKESTPMTGIRIRGKKRETRFVTRRVVRRAERRIVAPTPLAEYRFVRVREEAPATVSRKRVFAFVRPRKINEERGEVKSGEENGY